MFTFVATLVALLLGGVSIGYFIAELRRTYR